MAIIRAEDPINTSLRDNVVLGTELRDSGVAESIIVVLCRGEVEYLYHYFAYNGKR